MCFTAKDLAIRSPIIADLAVILRLLLLPPLIFHDVLGNANGKDDHGIVIWLHSDVVIL